MAGRVEPARRSPYQYDMQYIAAHHSHVTFVTISILLFLLRGGLMFAGSPALRSPVLRIAPHVVDTMLLASALWLVHVLHLPFFQTPWLMAKVAGLVAYIVLGSLALRAGRPRRVRVTAFAAALFTVSWIVSVAILHHPAGFFGQPLRG
jgi:uncharacterized membrane protein SirB2